MATLIDFNFINKNTPYKVHFLQLKVFLKQSVTFSTAAVL